MKLCSYCKEEKEETEFYLRGDGHGLRSTCKPCYRQGLKGRTRSKTLKYKKSKAKATKIRAKKHKHFLMELLGNRCFDCKKMYPPAVMDFDHIDPSQKSFNIAAHIGWSLERLMPEAMKCQLRCSNCHRQRTIRLKHTGKELPS